MNLSGFFVEKRSQGIKTRLKSGKPVRIQLQEVKDDHVEKREKWVGLRQIGQTSGIGSYLGIWQLSKWR